MRNVDLGSAFVCLCLLASSLSAQDKAAAVDPSGTWRWEYELADQKFLDSIQVKVDSSKKVSGSYKGRAEKRIELTEVKMDADTLSFNLALEYENTPIKLAFKGKVKQDDIDGTVAMTSPDGTQEFPWAPKRSVQMEDVIGTWQMRIETGDRVLEPTVTISKEGDQYKGKYASGEDFKADVRDLKIEQNQLVFKVEADVNGTKVKADYKGRPYGDKIQGSIAYVLGDNSGDIDFTGVLKADKP